MSVTVYVLVFPSTSTSTSRRERSSGTLHLTLPPTHPVYASLRFCFFQLLTRKARWISKSVFWWISFFQFFPRWCYLVRTTLAFVCLRTLKKLTADLENLSCKRKSSMKVRTNWLVYWRVHFQCSTYTVKTCLFNLSDAGDSLSWDSSAIIYSFIILVIG